MWTWVNQYKNVSILDLLKLRMTEVVVTTGAIMHAKLQSNHHHQQIQLSYRLEVLPNTQLIMSKH